MISEYKNTGKGLKFKKKGKAEKEEKEGIAILS